MQYQWQSSNSCRRRTDWVRNYTVWAADQSIQLVKFDNRPIYQRNETGRLCLFMTSNEMSSIGNTIWQRLKIKFVSISKWTQKNVIESVNQLMQLCTARTAWSESDQAVRTVHSCNSWRLGPLWSDSVIKLVSVLFGKCTTLVFTKFWPMETRLPCADQWKAEKLGAF